MTKLESSINQEGANSDRGYDQLFYFLHRKRLWNASEGKWIGWERKRGKLHELNLLLRGGKNLSFFPNLVDTAQTSEILQNIRFVITLDTDTILPRGAACRLAGTLAHPLNQAKFDIKHWKNCFRLHHTSASYGNSPKKFKSFMVYPVILG